MENFWIQYVGTPRACFDSVMREKTIGQWGVTHLVIHCDEDDFAPSVQEIHDQFPWMRVLRYTQLQRVNETTGTAGTMFDTCLAMGTRWGVIRNSDGQPKVLGTAPNRECWMDITNEEYLNWAVDHIAAKVKESGADGFAVDGFHTNIDDPFTLYQNGEELNRLWPAGCQRFMRLAAKKMPGKERWYNSWYSQRGEEELALSASLSRYSTGASSEHFGYAGNSNFPTNTYNLFVELPRQYYELYPKFRIVAHLTTPGGTYADYMDTMQIARYTTAAFKTTRGAETPLVSGFYSDNFLVKDLVRERHHGLSWFCYNDIDLGEPTTDTLTNGTGGEYRVFERGAVYIAPHERGDQVFSAVAPGYTPTGVHYPRAGSEIRLAAQDALILHRDKPSPPEDIDVDVSTSATDWLVQMVNHEWRYKFLDIEVSSTDVNSLICIRHDNDANPRCFGVFRLYPTGGSFNPTNIDRPYRHTSAINAQHTTLTQTYTPDGTRQKITINLDESTDFGCYRVRNVVALGSVTVHSIRLYDATPIIPLFPPDDPVEYCRCPRPAE